MSKEITHNKKHVILLLILLAGFILRLVYLYYLKDTVFFAPLLMDKHDQKTFMIWAQQILKNPWLVDGKAFYMAPLYPYFLAVLHFFSAGNLVLIVTLQLVLDIVLCGLIFFLGKKIYNAWVGLLAAFFACFYKTSIVYASSILSDSLIFFLYILFIVLVYNALEKPNFCRWLIAGIVLGLAALSKPTIAIYLPFLFIGLYLYPDKKLLPLNISKKFHPVLALLLLLIVSGLTILPVTLRNYYVSGKLIPICTNGLVNWQIGNSSDSIGLFYYPKGELLSPFSIAFWKLFVTKLNIFFTSYEWPQNLNVYMMETIIPFLKTAFVRFGLIIPMGMGGLLVLMLNWKKNFIFISFAITNVLWVVLFFIVDRYRLPAVGCFMVSAAFLMVWSIEKIRQKKFFAPLAVWVPVAAFAYFFNIIPGQLIPSVSIETFAGLSVRNIENAILTGDLEGGYRKAETYYRLMPGDFRSNFMLACVLSDMGKKQAAIYYLEQTLKINPGFEPAQRFIKDLKNS